MAEMGMYCKAYPLTRFREFAGWTEHPGSLDATETPATDTPAAGTPADGAAGAAETGDQEVYLFLQENYVVTNGVFMDEGVVFDAVSPEWKEFCHTVLEFEIPPYEVKEPAPAAAAESHA